MGETRIKICGITSAEDATACCALGADYLGIIFAASPRAITVERAKVIRKAVPQAALVGVFADSSIATVVATARAVGLDLIQLHGSEQPSYCKALATSTQLPLIKAFRLDEAIVPGGLGLFAAVAHFLLDLDKQNSGAGPALSDLWSAVSRAQDVGYEMFLAGALTCDNVNAAVRKAAPFCVDVCSGVEAAPGRKNLDSVGKFIAEARKC